MNTNIKDRFFNHLAIKDRRENTFKAYNNSINQFYEYFQNLLQIDDEKKLLLSINNDMIEDYMQYLVDQNYSCSTINSRLNSLKSFFKYVVVNKKIISTNPFDGIPNVSEGVVNVAKKQKDVLTREELKKILDTTYVREPNERDFELCSARNRFIIAMLHSCGLRSEELLQAEESWLRKIENGYMLCIPKEIVKNKIDKIVPICGVTLTYYNEYIEERNKLGKIQDKNIILLSARGKKLTTTAVNNMIQKYVNRLEIPKTISSHCGRHYFATQTGVNNFNENMVKRIGGWKFQDIKNSIYTHDNSIFDQEKIKICSSLI